MLIGSVPAFAEESGEEYYIDVELKYYTSDRMSLKVTLYSPFESIKEYTEKIR